MIGHEVGARSDRGVQRGDVRVSDERFRMVAPRRVVEAVEQSHRAIAAANAPDGVDRIVGDEGVEVGASRLVGAGEIRVALEHVGADDRLPSQHSRIRNCALEIGIVAQRPRRCDERDTRACFERRR